MVVPHCSRTKDVTPIPLRLCRQRRHTLAQQKMLGMTLIEILIAMSILAILSVLGYKAFSNVLIARERLMDTSRQWVELARVFRRMETDWSRLPTEAGIEFARQMGKPSYRLQLTQNETEGQLSLTVYSMRSPSGRETLAYRWGRSGLSWRVVRRSDVPADGPYELLPAGFQVHWRLMIKEGDYRDNWPVEGEGESQLWPQALEMRIVLPDGTAVTRLWEVP